MMPSLPKTPHWMVAVIIIVTLPVFQFPMLLASAPDLSSVKALVCAYPFYCIVAAYLAWQCYPQRKALAWVLLALMVMSHLAMWLLVTTPLSM